MHQLSYMGADADSEANLPLPPESDGQVTAMPGAVALKAEYHRLAALL